MRIWRNIRSPKGFTIAELMVGFALAAVAGVVLFSVFSSTQGMYYETREIMENQADSRVVMGMMAQEIRSAGSDLQQVGLQRVSTASTDSLRVQSDLNGDGVLTADEPAEDVLYWYDGTDETLNRTTGNGDAVLIRDVESLTFAYFDANQDALVPLPLTPNQRAAVRAVQIDMSVRLKDGTLRDWSSMVAIRNEGLGTP